jgi:hypothetical protein
MSYVVFFALLLLITLLASYLVIENNRRVAAEMRKKQFNDRVTQVKVRLKSKLSVLIDDRISTPKHISSIQAIVGNYFVVQPHTDENLEQLENLTDSLIDTLGSALFLLNGTDNKQILTDKIQYFAEELPSQGVRYNRTFYKNTLPILIKNLAIESLPTLTESTNSNNDIKAAPTFENTVQNEGAT